MRRITHVLVFIFMAMFVAQGTEIEGRVRLTGTSMFPTIQIVTADNTTYYVDDELFEQFIELQHKTVKINAIKIEDEIWELADGSKTFVRPTIYEATLIEVLNESEI